MAGDAVIIAGFGFRKSATERSLLDAFIRATSGGQSVDGIATAADKAETAVFQSVSRQLALPAIGVPDALLTSQSVITQSAASDAARGTGSVAEAAAMAGAGRAARLLQTRVISGDGLATCALAEGKDP